MMTTLKLPHTLVSVDWLASHLKHPRLVVLDSSLKAPVNKGLNNSRDLRIPGARIFDFDKRICDSASPLPHMMPSEALFTQEVRILGICKNSVIVVYDNRGIYSSPRAWWMLKAMGHEQVAVLDGGMPAWINANLPCEQSNGSQQVVVSGDFVAKQSTTHFCNVTQVESALEDDGAVVLDARSEKRFLGQEPEPRSGLRSGHMPNALNIPFDLVLKAGHMKSVKELKEIFSAKANPQKNLIFSCGSGVTACVLALAADLAGYSKIAVYDGSWSEWGLKSSSRPALSSSV